jgi:hypothetical protein
MHILPDGYKPNSCLFPMFLPDSSEKRGQCEMLEDAQISIPLDPHSWHEPINVNQL